MTKNADYFVENPSEFEHLTDDQKELVVNGGSVDDQGDTEASGDAVELPDAEETSPAPEAGENDPNAPEPELLAKDGKHVIPYAELEEARAKAAQWEELAKRQTELIEALKAAKVEDEQAGQGETSAQEQVLAEYQGDFAEIAEDLKPFIQRMIDEGVKTGMSAFQAEITEQVKPAQTYALESARKEHFAAIEQAHDDWQALVKDPKLFDWIGTLPSFMQDQCNQVLAQGTAGQVIELFSAFKDANKLPAAPAADSKAKAEEIIANTKKPAPGSLTDIPSSINAQHDEIEAVQNMTPAQLEAKFANKSPEEIRTMLSRLV